MKEFLSIELDGDDHVSFCRLDFALFQCLALLKPDWNHWMPFSSS